MKYSKKRKLVYCKTCRRIFIKSQVPDISKLQ